MSDGRNALAIMTRTPSSFRSKTRLLGALDSPGRHLLPRCLLLDTLDRSQQVGGVELVVVYTPAGAAQEVAGLVPPGCHLLPQRRGSLGRRMHYAFTDLFSRGFTIVMLIGSDLPTLPPTHISLAAETLQRAGDRVVLGPTEDGGYYLIGLKQPHPELFATIAWGTSEVLAQTRTRAERHRLECALIPEWFDVDTVEDLRRLAHSKSPGGVRTQAWLRETGFRDWDSAIR
jgi:rSAM/selenodomain-associated transferase 1